MSEAEEATVRMLPLRLLLRDAEAAGAEAVFAPLLRLVVALFPAAPPARLVASPALGAPCSPCCFPRTWRRRGSSARVRARAARAALMGGGGRR